MIAMVFSQVRLVALILVGAVVGIVGGYILQSKVIGSNAPAQTVPLVDTIGSTSIANVVPAATLHLGPQYRLKSRVFNLKDDNARRYAKIAITLQFADATDKYEKMNGEAFTTASTVFEKEISAEKDFIDDTLTTVIGSKTLAEVLNNDGKEALKQQIVAELNRGFTALRSEHRIAKVFFTDFVIQ